MGELVLRSDVITLKSVTERLCMAFFIEIHEAADIVNEILCEHGASIDFWVIPPAGLPYKYNGLNLTGSYCSNQWLDSRWWDKEYQQQQEDVKELAGQIYRIGDERIENLALLKKTVRKIFSEACDRLVECCKDLPKNKVLSLTKFFDFICKISSNRLNYTQVSGLFGKIYDPDLIMIYINSDSYLCYPMNGSNSFGYNDRSNISSEISGKHQVGEYDKYCICNEHAVVLAEEIWMHFFNEPLNKAAITLGIEEAIGEMDFCTKTASHTNINLNDGNVTEKVQMSSTSIATLSTSMKQTDTDIDPSDLPPELDAANMAYRAVLKGSDKTGTFKKRLVAYLQKNYAHFTEDAINRIATVANPDKSTGRPKQ